MSRAGVALRHHVLCGPLHDSQLAHGPVPPMLRSLHEIVPSLAANLPLNRVSTSSCDVAQKVVVSGSTS